MAIKLFLEIIQFLTGGTVQTFSCSL